MFGKKTKQVKQMKAKENRFDRFQSISPKAAASIIGGNNNDGEDEYIYVIIGGVLYRVRKGKNGEPISEPEIVL
jgi:hypothetical protein